MMLKVVEFPSTVLDIPRKLRELADEVEQRMENEALDIVLVIMGDDVDVRGLGRVEGLAAMGVLHLGLTHLTTGTLKAVRDE